MAILEIIEETFGDVHVFVLCGRLVLESAHHLKTQIHGSLIKGNKIIIDMLDILYVDSSGSGELISIMNSGVDYFFVLCGKTGVKIIEQFEVIKVPIPKANIASDLKSALKLFEVKVAGS